MSRFIPTSRLKLIDPKEFNSNNYSRNSSKRCALEIDLEYPEEICELPNHYPLFPDKIEIKKEAMCNYQLKIADL